MTSQDFQRDIAWIIWTSGSDRNLSNNFRNEGAAVKLGFFTFWNFAAISQQFRSCEMRVTVLRNGTRVPRLVSQLPNTLRNGAFPAKWRISCFGGSQPLSQLRNGGHCAAKWHSCAKSGFAAAKIFAERAIGLRTGFAAKFQFRRGCEISQTPVFPLFLPCFRSVWLRFCSDFFSSISLQFLLILIIQKPILHQNKLELKHWNQN